MTNSVFNLKSIGCNNCGANIIFDPKTQVARCNYCGASFDPAEAHDENVIEADGIIPFKVTKEDFDEQVLNWLIQGDYTPDDILDGSLLDNVNGIYVPFYLFHGIYSGEYTATIGFNRQEAYTDYEYHVGSPENRRQVTRFRTVVDWKPVSGTFKNNFSLLGTASATLSDDQIEFCNDSEADPKAIKPLNDLYLQGYGLGTFDTSEDIIFSDHLASRLDKIIKIDVYRRLSGDKQRDVHWDKDVTYDSIARAC